MEGRAATVSVRRRGGEVVEDQAWLASSPDLLGSAVPWRTFRWHKGQKHYSGTYWSATTRDHVIYESRLELARLLFADFDPSVRGILAQPFLLKAAVDGQVRKHIPDYFLITEECPVVVVEHTDQSRPSRTLVIERTRARVMARFGPDVVPQPSRATAFRASLSTGSPLAMPTASPRRNATMLCAPGMAKRVRHRSSPPQCQSSVRDLKERGASASAARRTSRHNGQSSVVRTRRRTMRTSLPRCL
jgi:hypothetical protein